jgi:hypothetical protein
MTTAARRSACSHAGLRFTAPAAGVYTVRATRYEIAANNNDTIDPNADGDNTLTIVGRGVGIEELERRTYASYVWSLPVMSRRDIAEAIQSFTPSGRRMIDLEPGRYSVALRVDLQISAREVGAARAVLALQLESERLADLPPNVGVRRSRRRCRIRTTAPDEDADQQHQRSEQRRRTRGPAVTKLRAGSLSTVSGVSPMRMDAPSGPRPPGTRGCADRN